MPDDSDQIPWDEIQEHLFAGRRIEAIKAYRNATEADLKASKEFIEELEARLRDEFPDHFKASSKPGCAGMMLLVLVIGGVVMLVLLGVAFTMLF